MRQHWRRALAVLAVGVLLVLLLSVDTLYEQLQRLLVAAEPLISAHPAWGAVLFVVLSAVSALLAFFSSALLVPVAVYTWGQPATIALLWLGWLLGGVSAYGLGHLFGRPLVRTLASRRISEFYLERLPARVDFPVALLIQLALPSEVPGYLFGVLRVRFAIYLAVLALVEAPFAIGTVLLGDSIVRREGGWLLALVLMGLGVSLLAVYLLHRRLAGEKSPRAP